MNTKCAMLTQWMKIFNLPDSGETGKGRSTIPPLSRVSSGVACVLGNPDLIEPTAVFRYAVNCEQAQTV